MSTNPVTPRAGLSPSRKDPEIRDAIDMVWHSRDAFTQGHFGEVGETRTALYNAIDAYTDRCVLAARREAAAEMREQIRRELALAQQIEPSPYGKQFLDHATHIAGASTSPLPGDQT